MTGLTGVFLVLLCLMVGAWGVAMTVLGAAKRRRVWSVRGLALVCLALGVGVYAWGIAAVGLTLSEASHGTDSSPAPACRRDRATVIDHRAGYFPPRFDCVRADGTTYSAGVVTWWLTPAAVVLTAAGAALWVVRGRAPKRRRPLPLGS